MPSYFRVSKIDINILLEFVLPAVKVGGGGLKNTKTFRFVKTIGNNYVSEKYFFHAS